MKLNVNINAHWPVKVGIVAVKKSNYAAITFLEVMQRQFLRNGTVLGRWEHISGKKLRIHKKSSS